MELTDPKVANIRISRSFEISLLNTKGKVLLLVAASVRYRFFNAGCWKIVGEGNTQLRAYSWTCMVQARTSIKIQWHLPKRSGEGEKKKKQKRRNKFEVGLRSNAFDLNERTPECYDQSAQKAGVTVACGVICVISIRIYPQTGYFFFPRDIRFNRVFIATMKICRTLKTGARFRNIFTMRSELLKLYRSINNNNDPKLQSILLFDKWPSPEGRNVNLHLQERAMFIFPLPSQS